MKAEVLSMVEQSDGILVTVKVGEVKTNALFDDGVTKEKIQDFMEEIEEQQLKKQENVNYKAKIDELKDLIGKRIDLSKNEEL